MVEMSDALRFLFSEQLDFFFFFSSPHPLTELKVVVLSIWCSRLGPNGWWRVAACTVHFCGKEESDEPETDAQDHVGGSNFAPLPGGTKNTWQHVHRSKRKKMVLGYASVWSPITVCHHRYVFHLIMNKTFKASRRTPTSNELFTVEYQHCSSFSIALHHTIPVQNSHVQWQKYEIYHILFKNPNSLIMACLFSIIVSDSVYATCTRLTAIGD